MPLYMNVIGVFCLEIIITTARMTPINRLAPIIYPFLYD
jgi:hypothetical protein